MKTQQHKILRSIVELKKTHAANPFETPCEAMPPKPCFERPIDAREQLVNAVCHLRTFYFANTTSGVRVLESIALDYIVLQHVQLYCCVVNERLASGGAAQCIALLHSTGHDVKPVKVLVVHVRPVAAPGFSFILSHGTQSILRL